MRTTTPPPESLLAFRQRAMSVAAGVLAAGLALLAVVLELTNPVIVATDVTVLLSASAVHAVAARTVGRWWEPGGAVCGAYLVVMTLLLSIMFIHADTPQSDAFWFLLVPVGLSGATMRGPSHAAVTVFGLATYVVMTWLGPGLDVPLTSSRVVSMSLFGLAMHAFAGRLERALVDADAAHRELAEQFDEVRRLNDRLTELDRAKDDFVSTVSHELRTPLTVIQGLSTTLEGRWDQLPTDQRRVVARRLGASARGLEGIVATLLDLARIDRGGLDPVRRPVPLRGAVDEALDRVGSLLEEHVVDVRVADDVVVHTDAQLLERVLDNLLTNAARHTASGTAVHVRAVAGGAGRVRLEVADEGDGVPAEQLARLGEQFFRARDGVGAEDGTGLGLALVRDVLDALGTRLEITSEVGRGTTFSFALPVASGAANAGEPATVPARPAGPGDAS